MSKKPYNKPELKTRKIELGVFGDYGSNRGKDLNIGVGTGSAANPVGVIEDLGLRME